MNIIRVSDKEALEDFMLTERVRQVEELVIPELMREIARAISQLSVLPPGFIMRLPLTNTPKLAIAPVEAVKGYGLFAMEEVDSNTVIGEYTGVLTKGCDCSSLDYAFHYRHPNFTGDTRAYIDAQEAGNYTRFINHSIGNANITPEFVSDGQYLRLIFRSFKRVQAGDELCFNYNTRQAQAWTERNKTRIQV